jgi:hypothetical protein
MLSPYLNYYPPATVFALETIISGIPESLSKLENVFYSRLPSWRCILTAQSQPPWSLERELHNYFDLPYICLFTLLV